MNVFSNHLSSIVLQKEVNITQMAAFCKIDRSSMYKIIHGTRKPPSESLVELISLYLKLTPEESSLLMENYRIVLMGEEKYCRRKAAMAFLKKCFADSPVLTPPSYLSLPDLLFGEMKDDIEVMLGKSNVLGAIVSIILEERKLSSPSVLFRMKPDKMVLDLIRTLCVQKSPGQDNPIQIQHIVAADENKEIMKSDISNLNLLCTLLPALMSVPNYDLRYFYANLSTGNTSFAFMVYAVITRNCVLQVSENLEFGILHRQPEIVEFFRNTYMDILSGSIPVTMEIRDIRDMLYCGSQRRNGNSFVTFHMGFCMSYMVDEYLLEKYVKKDLPNRSSLLKAALEINEKDRQHFKTAQATIIVSHKGIIDFMKTGILPGGPAELCSPIEPSDRLLLLKKYIEMIRSCPAALHIIREPFGNTSSGNQVWLDESLAIILLQNSPGVRRVLMLRDSGLLSLLNDFLHNIPEDICIPPAESLEILQDIYTEYSKKATAAD